jgi:hypothetical protein
LRSNGKGEGDHAQSFPHLSHFAFAKRAPFFSRFTGEDM